MDQDKQAKLNKHRLVLIQDLDAMPVVDHLVSTSIFNNFHAVEIQNIRYNKDRNRRLLATLITKGAEAFHQFLVALRATNQHTLATLLDGQNHIEELQQIKKVDSSIDSECIARERLLDYGMETRCTSRQRIVWRRLHMHQSLKWAKIAGKYIRIALPAVGLLPREKLKIQKEIEPLLREVAIMTKLNHERVLKCFGYQATNIHLVIFMELMPNGSVFDEIRLKGAALDLQSTVKYLKQATEGLLYIHRQGVYHRDVKCANLLLDGDKNVKLADFGISVEVRVKNGLTSSTFTENDGSGGTKGTLLHMAPEALQSKTFTRKSDIWSMACTGVEMLTTMAPHEDTTEDWGQSKFILQAGLGNLKYVASELCPNASIEIQTLLDKLFKPVDQRLTTEQLLVEATLLFVTVY